MIENGFSKVKTSFGTADETGKAVAFPSYDDWVKESIEKSLSGKRISKGAAKELASAVSYMGTWVKDAAIANNRSYNNAVDALRRIEKTGQVTQADRAAIFRTIYDQAANAIIFGARGSRIPTTYTEEPSSQIGSDTKKSASTKLADLVSDFLNFSDADRKRIKDGWFDKLTGTASDRQLNIPMTGVNTDIFKGTIDRYLALFGGGNIDEALGKMVPREIQNMVDAKIGEGVKDFKGNDITPDLSEIAQDSPSLQAGIGAMLGKPTLTDVSGITAAKNDEEGLLNKYDRYSFEEIGKDATLKKQFKQDLKRIGIDYSAPGGIERVKTIIDRLRDADEKFPTSSTYKKINATATKIMSLGKGSPEYLDIKRDIPTSKVPQIAAEAILNNKLKMLGVLTHLDFIPEDREKLLEFKSQVKAKIKEIQSRKKETKETRKADNEAV